MSVFIRLVLTHLIADFPLQTDFIWRIRKESFWGNLLHGIIFILVAPLFCWHIFDKIWIYVVILGISHALIDYFKIFYFRKNGSDNIWYFVADQILHIFLIGIASMFIYIFNTGVITANTTVSLPEFSFSISYLKKILIYAYYQDKVICYAIFYIITTFAGAVIIYQIEKTFFKLREEVPIVKTPSSLLERALITTLVVIHEPLWIFLVVGVKIMVILVLSQEEKNYKFIRVMSFDVISSAVFAIFIGLILTLI